MVLAIVLGRQRECPSILPYWKTVDDQVLAVVLAVIALDVVVSGLQSNAQVHML